MIFTNNFKPLNFIFPSFKSLKSFRTQLVATVCYTLIVYQLVYELIISFNNNPKLIVVPFSFYNNKKRGNLLAELNSTQNCFLNHLHMTCSVG